MTKKNEYSAHFISWKQIAVLIMSIMSSDDGCYVGQTHALSRYIHAKNIVALQNVITSQEGRSNYAALEQ